MWLSLRFAGRELRSGARGFVIFMASIALGVAAIAAAGSTAQAFRAGLAAQSREILGGDLAASVSQRTFSTAERAAMSRLGRVSLAVALEAMGESAAGERHLVELRGVSPAWPLAGRVELSGAPDLAAALAPAPDGAWGAAVEPDVLARLHIRLGDEFHVGRVAFVARAILLSEPDRLSRGFALGPRVLTAFPAVESGGFLAGAIPFSETARIALPAGADVKAARGALTAALGRPGPGGARIEDRSDAAPGFRRGLDNLDWFLSFLGLATLLAGGLGVQAAVSAHLERRRPTIAILKALGAGGGVIRDTFLIQIAVLTLIAIAFGLALGADAPMILAAALKSALPAPAVFGVYPGPLLRAAGFGALAAAAFALSPLARARAASPAALLRKELPLRAGFGIETVGAVLAGVLLAALTILSAPNQLAGAVMVGGVAAAFAALWGLGALLALAARRGRGLLSGVARLGAAGLAGPGSAASRVMPALGLGTALLAAILLVQSSLLTQLSKDAPARAPSLVFTGIPPGRGPDFDATIERALGHRPDPADYLRAPFVTGRIVAVRGIGVDRLRLDPSGRWAYDQDLPMLVLGAAPPHAEVAAGRWWSAGERAPQAVLSLDAARGAHVAAGDTITLEILGQRIETRVAAVRRVDVAAFGPSTPIVLDEAVLPGAQLKSIAIARTSPAEERAIVRALGADFPEVNVISVREALAEAQSLFERLATALRAAAAVAGLGGALALAGAIAARSQARAREAAVLRALGASTGQLLAAWAVEYGAIGVAAGAVGLALGWAAAWPIVRKMFQAVWSVDPGALAILLATTVGATLIGAAAAAGAALARPPAATLREP